MMPYPGPPLDDVNSIRIMHLQPGQPGQDIYFELETIASIKEQPLPDYEALSYTWGDANVQQEIFCGDSSTTAATSLKVTTNCYNALQNLRYSDCSRILWIDAVCIDQANIEERNAQVQMMGSIFAGARHVVVYLGESADDSDLVMAWYQNNYDVPDYPRRDIAVSKPSSDAHRAFEERPWFRRTWILQEVANARCVAIKCGALTIPWSAYETGRPYTDGPVRRVLRLVGSLKASIDTAPESALLDVLRATRHCMSSDPRDKLFGVLPLIPNELVPGFLRPNYNLSPQELFTQVAHYVHKRLGPSLLSEVSKHRMESLPSWVPDWSQPSPKRFRPRNAGGDTLDTARYAAHDPGSESELRVQGIRIGSLAKLADVFKTPGLQDLVKWRPLAQEAEMLRRSSSNRRTRRVSAIEDMEFFFVKS